MMSVMMSVMTVLEAIMKSNRLSLVGGEHLVRSEVPRTMMSRRLVAGETTRFGRVEAQPISREGGHQRHDKRRACSDRAEGSAAPFIDLVEHVLNWRLTFPSHHIFPSTTRLHRQVTLIAP